MAPYSFFSHKNHGHLRDALRRSLLYTHASVCGELIADCIEYAIESYIRIAPENVRSCEALTYAWLHKAAHHEIVREKKRESRNLSFDIIDHKASEATDSKVTLEANDLFIELSSALDSKRFEDHEEYKYFLSRLTQNERKTIELVNEGYSLTETAAILSITLEAAKQRHARGSRHLEKFYFRERERERAISYAQLILKLLLTNNRQNLFVGCHFFICKTPLHLANFI